MQTQETFLLRIPLFSVSLPPKVKKFLIQRKLDRLVWKESLDWLMSDCDEGLVLLKAFSSYLCDSFLCKSKGALFFLWTEDDDGNDDDNEEEEE